MASAVIYVFKDNQKPIIEYIGGTAEWKSAIQSVIDPVSKLDWSDDYAIKDAFNRVQTSKRVSTKRKILAGLFMPYSLILPEDSKTVISTLKSSSFLIRDLFMPAVNILTMYKNSHMLLALDSQRAERELTDTLVDVKELKREISLYANNPAPEEINNLVNSLVFEQVKSLDYVKRNFHRAVDVPRVWGFLSTSKTLYP